MDQIPLGEIVSRVGGQQQFKAACLEHVLLKAQEDVMPLHASRLLPGSERITSDVRGLVSSFDPANKVEYTVEFDTLPKVKWTRPYRDIEVEVEETGSLATDEAAVDDLIRQYRKEKGKQRVVADRGLRGGDVAIVDMRIRPAAGGAGAAPYPGLDKQRLALDTEADPLGLSKVSSVVFCALCLCVCVCVLCDHTRCQPHKTQQKTTYKTHHQKKTAHGRHAGGGGAHL